MSKTAILAIRIIADAAGATKGLEQATSGLDKFERGIDRASKYAAVGLGAAAAGAWKAAEAASDLGESTNAVQKVFESSSGTITSFGETAAKTVGLSQREFQTLATSTGSLLTNMGQSTADAADNTVILAQRAADMASVFNTDVGTALNAINAGLRGESEPLRAFGVGLSDAAIKSQAMAMGLYDGKGALDANAKAAAVQALILEQSSKTQGDFADTSDSLANRQRTLTASMEDTAAQLGTALLPYFEQAVGILQKVADWVSQNTDLVTKLAAGLTIAAAAVLAVNGALKLYRGTMVLVNAVQAVANSRVIATTASTIAYQVITKSVRAALVLWTAAQWLLNAALTANPIGLVVAAIALLIGGLVLAYKKSDTFREMVQALGRTLGTVLGAAIRGVSAAFSTLVGWFQSAWNWAKKVAGAIGDLIGKLNPIKSLGGLIGKVLPGGQSAPLGITRGAYYPPALARGARSAEPLTPVSSAVGAAGTVVINVNAADPWSTARAIKRSLSNLDVSMGRAPGAVQAPAW